MPLRHLLSRALAASWFGGVKPFVQFGRRHHEEHFCEIILNLDQWFSRRCFFNDISYLDLWRPICSAEQNHLCNFGKGHYEEQFCEIILNLDKCFRRCHFKIFLIWSSGSPPVRWSRTICAILKEGFMGNIHVK